MVYKILIASTNEGKIKEISWLLNSIDAFRVSIFSLKDYGKIPEPDEPFDSFIENAIHKSKYYSKYTNIATLSEDSGLSIEALNGFPGVKSKDLIEESGSVSNAFLKLEEMLKGNSNNSCYFSSAVALYMPSHNFLVTQESRQYGSIVFPARGHTGIGFDPIFIPQGYDRTFAELGIEIKTKISHRARAMEGLIHKFQKFLNNGICVQKN